ncbi:hypothetical protein [Cobetia sp. L2A1]|uniref:hypothetical protein n=1 Tax=Cobetia sp. L2A1 TaxID=2686360 RepID=UPI00131CC667|nr:hypothetical protein [Cobetia sp. L2A1]
MTHEGGELEPESLPLNLTLEAKSLAALMVTLASCRAIAPGMNRERIEGVL